MVGCLFCSHSAGDSLQRFPEMTAETLKSAPNRAAPAGFAFLTIVSVGGGINWPVQKLILAEWPPMAARGSSGLVAAVVLAILAILLRQSLRVPAGAWVRILTSGFLNIGLWVILMGYGLTMMPASEAAIIAYTMPVWTVLLAWPILGERLTVRRVIAMVLAFAGIAVLLGGSSAQASLAKLPGYALALGSAITYALGTIFLKRFPIPMPAFASAAWQLGAGCLPVAMLGFVFERPDIAALTVIGWSALAYNAFFQQSLGFVCWLAALQRLPASVAAIGTLIVPVIGVLASAYVLGEPLGPAQLTALALTVGGVLLAVRS
jgi:drug/metabolite transporter (DMT)-like permease